MVTGPDFRAVGVSAANSEPPRRQIGVRTYFHLSNTASLWRVRITRMVHLNYPLLSIKQQPDTFESLACAGSA